MPDPADESEPGDADGREDADCHEGADSRDETDWLREGADSRDEADWPRHETDGVPTDPLDALATALALKDERRTGWQLRGVTDPESVAAHSWGVSLLALLFTPPHVDRDRVLRMAVVHDLGEALVGDVPTRADPADQPLDRESKVDRERTVIESFARAFDGAPPTQAGEGSAPAPAPGRGRELAELWTAYEARDTPEARLLKDFDLLDTCVQALAYERAGRYEPGASDAFEEYEALDEFFATAEPRLSTSVGRSLFETVRSAYERAKREYGDAHDAHGAHDEDATEER